MDRIREVGEAQIDFPSICKTVESVSLYISLLVGGYGGGGWWTVSVWHYFRWKIDYWAFFAPTILPPQRLLMNQKFISSKPQSFFGENFYFLSCKKIDVCCRQTLIKIYLATLLLRELKALEVFLWLVKNWFLSLRIFFLNLVENIDWKWKYYSFESKFAFKLIVKNLLSTLVDNYEIEFFWKLNMLFELLAKRTQKMGFLNVKKNFNFEYYSYLTKDW